METGDRSTVSGGPLPIVGLIANAGSHDSQRMGLAMIEQHDPPLSAQLSEFRIGHIRQVEQERSLDARIDTNDILQESPSPAVDQNDIGWGGTGGAERISIRAQQDMGLPDSDGQCDR